MFHSLSGGTAGRATGEAEGAKVKVPAIVDKLQSQLADAEEGIGTGLAGKKERTFSSGVKGDKSQRGEHRGIRHNAGCLDAYPLKGAQQKLPEGIVSHLA